jgi:hypothetical protein
MRLAIAILLFTLQLPSAGNKREDQPKTKDRAGEYSQQSAGGLKIPTTVDQPPHSNGSKKAPDEETDSNPKTKPFMSNAEWIMAGLTACYVILTGVYVYYSRRTLEKIEEQVELIKAQEDANSIQSGIAQEGAAAASAIAQTLVEAQRPFVMIEYQGNPPQFWAVNRGWSPARIIYADTAPRMAHALPDELPRILWYGAGYDTPNCEQFNVPWIPPRGRYCLGSPDPAYRSYFTPAEDAEVSRGERIVIAYLSVKYKGLDGKNVYTSTYCYRLYHDGYRMWGKYPEWNANT